MNAIHPPKTNADLPESATPTVSADRKLKSWELRDFVLTYQTYPSPGASLVAARLAGRYNAEKGYSYETQRQIADATGYDTSTVKVLLKEIESTGLWTIVVGKRGTATHYAPVAAELNRAKMFIEYRLAGRLSALPFKPVPNFKRPSKKAGFGGFAQTAKEAKKARDIREAAEAAAMEQEQAATAYAPEPEPVSAPEPEHEITAYTPDDMDDIPLPDEPDFYEPAEADDPFLSRTLVDPTEQFPEQFPAAPAAPIAKPAALVVRDGCPF